MAKFARVGYGSKGQGVGHNPDGYTYIVNDNVRTGDKIQVVSTSRAGRKFGTTAVPLSTFKESSVKGQQAKIDVLSKGDKEVGRLLGEATSDGMISKKDIDMMTQGKITTVKSGTELGISRAGLSQKQYTQMVRGGNLQGYSNLTKKAQESFDSYSAKFMNKGEQQ